MDLKEFISETMSAIADATNDLQEKYAADDILINPPSAQSGNEVYQAASEDYTFRRVQNIGFDVAVTASSKASKDGKAGIKVMSLEIGAEAGKSITSEQVSRVAFSIPITLKPSQHEQKNLGIKERNESERKARSSNFKRKSVV